MDLIPDLLPASFSHLTKSKEREYARFLLRKMVKLRKRIAAQAKLGHISHKDRQEFASMRWALEALGVLPIHPKSQTLRLG